MNGKGVRETVPLLPLFVPANRPDRIAKAATSGTDAVIVDLEDAVAESEKERARTALREALAGQSLPVPVLVRVNAFGTGHFEPDLTTVAALPVDGIVLPKADATVGLEDVRDRLGTGRALVALVETPQGMADARALARGVDRIAFGSIDFAGAIGAAHRRESLLAARSELVLASALASSAPPIDGVTTRIDTGDPVEDDARYAAALGFGGKLLIHPAQLAPAIRGFAPDPQDVEYAREILERDSGNAARVDGDMVDRPVIDAARRQVEAYRRAQERLAEVQQRRC